MKSKNTFTILPFLFIFFTCISYSQMGEGHKFCDELKDGKYFPLSYEFKKKILWSKSFYWETREGTKVINGKTYVEIKQEWEDKSIVLLYCREENGVVYQYDEELKRDDIRFDENFKENKNWKLADGKTTYKIISYNGVLRTPYCEYKNLLVIDAVMNYGHFNFYYLKGHGYIGATKDGHLISCLTPEW
ncbi:hypothetical protein [Flavobacterium reichenbachii]|nr:hypothetical protein [Flavobacterium reichenbachii]